MDKSAITVERKDEIIEALLEQFVLGVVENGPYILDLIMTEEEQKAYLNSLSAIDFD